jgi:hypothetical protein
VSVVGEGGEVRYELEHCDIPKCSELEYCEEVRERAWDYGRPKNVPSYKLVTNQASHLDKISYLQTPDHSWVEVTESLFNFTSNFTEALRYPNFIAVRIVSNAPLELTFRAREKSR